MRKFLPLIASMLLLASCGGSSSSAAPSSAAPSSAVDSSAEASETSVPVQRTLTFLEDGELYLDFNFNSFPEGFSVKVGETVFTAPGKIKMTQGFTHELAGVVSMKVYYIIDANGVVNNGKNENGDATKIQSFADTLLTRFASTYTDYRIYLCFSDQVSGWSKTLPGVNETLGSSVPNN